jgi:hypothetical protein
MAKSILPLASTLKASSLGETQERALSALVARMKYYPVVQALSRSGAAWNEFQGDTGSFASNLTSNVCSPSIGIGYFIVFLVSMEWCAGCEKT